MRLLLALLFMLPYLIQAASYSVPTDGTINDINALVGAGDTVTVDAGTYTGQTISPAVSGTAGNPITYVASGAVTLESSSAGISLTGKDYITVEGFTFGDNISRYVLLDGSDHTIITNNVFDGTRTYSLFDGVRIVGSSTNFRLQANTFANWGRQSAGGDQGDLLSIGEDSLDLDNTSFGLIEDNTIRHGGHVAIGVFGNRIIVRNNKIHNEDFFNDGSGGLAGNRCLSLFGYPNYAYRCLIEGNDISHAGDPVDTAGSNNIDLRTHLNIIRRNRLYYADNNALIMQSYNVPAGIQPKDNHVYHNTLHKNGQGQNGTVANAAIGFIQGGSGQSITGNIFKNNIMFDSEGATYAFSGTDSSLQTFANNWEQQGDPLFIDITGVTPSSTTKPDLNLRSSSPSIDAGGFLTTITSASGTGTSFVVDDAGYFMDGWGLIEGDQIQLQGSSTTLTISNIDYGTDTITFSPSISWGQGTGVALVYNGLAPDQGAYETSYNAVACATYP